VLNIDRGSERLCKEGSVDVCGTFYAAIEVVGGGNHENKHGGHFHL
jgi:hypothetical protein